MTDENRVSRRIVLKAAMGAGILSSIGVQRLEALAPDMLTRAIPSSGEQLPVIGIGTATLYDVSSEPEKQKLAELIARFPALGGKCIETSPQYGRTEAVLGELIARTGTRSKLFLATTVTADGRDRSVVDREVNESFRRLQTDKIDLLQIGSVNAAERLLPMLRELKGAGRIRYIGVSVAGEEHYEALEGIMRRESLDFIQVDYAANNRTAAERILPLAVEKKIAVMVNMPFSGNELFVQVLGKPIPSWSRDIGASSWAQIFLKYIVAHPAVTCVIPGTAKLAFLLDNLAAGAGRLPSADLRRRIEESVEKRA